MINVGRLQIPTFSAKDIVDILFYQRLQFITVQTDWDWETMKVSSYAEREKLKRHLSFYSLMLWQFWLFGIQLLRNKIEPSATLHSIPTRAGCAFKFKESIRIRLSRIRLDYRDPVWSDSVWSRLILIWVSAIENLFLSCYLNFNYMPVIRWINTGWLTVHQGKLY